MIGRELIHDSSLSKIEKIYVLIFGAPISGLRIRARRILPLLDRLKFRDVLDVGCGMGFFSFEIARKHKNIQVIGIDNDKELIERNNSIAGQSGLINSTFMFLDISNMEFREKFDLVFCIDMLEHLENDMTAIGLIYDALRKGGKAIFHVPGFYRRWLFFRKKVNFDVKGHVRPGYTLEQIKGKIKKNNFKILSIYYTYGYLETITNNISYLITRAEKKNKYLYAIIFPVLNFLAFLGHWERPSWGAGVLIKVQK